MSVDTVQQAQPYKVVRSDAELQAELLGIVPVSTATTSGVSFWLNPKFVVVILVAIPLLYCLGYIGVVWLSRTGIILNLCAGFMIAPELIGNRGLYVIQTNIKQVLSQFKGFMSYHRRTSASLKLLLVPAIVVFAIYIFILSASLGTREDIFPDYLTRLAPLYIIYSGSLIIVITIIFFIALLLDYSSRKLIDDSNLRSAIKNWGIVFFIVGNLLQFISTF